jgi:hypothetical protein
MSVKEHRQLILPPGSKQMGKPGRKSAEKVEKLICVDVFMPIPGTQLKIFTIGQPAAAQELGFCKGLRHQVR